MSTTIDFSEVAVPDAETLTDHPAYAPPSDDDAPTVNADRTDDLACVVCGTPLHYAGKGRKPKFCVDHKQTRTAAPTAATAARMPRGSGDVEMAMARMDMFYKFAVMGLMPISPTAAAAFAEGVPQAQMGNRMAFEADRSLCRRINTTTKNTGALTFVAANAMLIVPVVRIAVADIASRRAVDIVESADEPFPDFA